MHPRSIIRTFCPCNIQSIKCSQCGKTFKNTALANFHAEKSGHDQFEESTEEVRQPESISTLVESCEYLLPTDQTFDRGRKGS